MMVLTIGALSFYQWSKLQSEIGSVTRSLSETQVEYDQSVQHRIEEDRSQLTRLYREVEANNKPLSETTDKRFLGRKKEIEDDITALENDTSPLKTHFDNAMKRRIAVLTELQNTKFPWISGRQSFLALIVCLTTIAIVGAFIIMPSFLSIFGIRLNPTERGLLIYSERLALKLDYELTRSSERGFELSPTSWLKGGSKLSSEERARGLSLPELTASYIEFVSNVLRVFPGKLLICIDELDKVTDIEHVRFILREIKGALYVKGTFYVVSISNDALRSFEGRMGDQRDIFESTFDDVFAVRPLDIETCLEILTNRIAHGKSSDEMTAIKLDTLATISVFSGGNARDLVRGFRECALSSDTAELPAARDAWKILFDRRFDAINDRARAAGGSAEVRSCFIPLLDLETLGSDTEGNELVRLQNCCKKLNQYIDRTTSDLHTSSGDDVAVARRFLRYAVELEILLQARERVSFTAYGEEVRKDAALIISAYQILPFSTADAESILCNLGRHGTRGEDAAPTITAPTVRSLDRPLADRGTIA